MKNSRNFVALICLLLVFISGAIAVSAADIAFSTESLDQEDVETILSNVNITNESTDFSEPAMISVPFIIRLSGETWYLTLF